MCVSVCVCACVRVCVCACVRVYVCACVRGCVCARVCMSMYMSMCMCVFQTLTFMFRLGYPSERYWTRFAVDVLWSQTPTISLSYNMFTFQLKLNLQRQAEANTAIMKHDLINRIRQYLTLLTAASEQGRTFEEETIRRTTQKRDNDSSRAVRSSDSELHVLPPEAVGIRRSVRSLSGGCGHSQVGGVTLRWVGSLSGGHRKMVGCSRDNCS